MEILCEGALLVPPDRGTIIGRAVWKPRYVVLGHQNPLGALLPRSSSSHRLGAGRKAGKVLSLNPSRDNITTLGPPDQLWLSIYKGKDDLELLSQYTISLCRSCEIQSLQYRKPGPTINTLVIVVDPDPTAEKARKRRSSRAGGLSSSSHANTVLFRTIPEERYNIYDWQAIIRPRIRSKTSNTYEEPMSPGSPPALSSFIGPFSPRTDTFDRGPMSPRPDLQRVSSDHTFASAQTGPVRDRDPASSLVSPSPSLRSKSSNVSSSQASSFGRPPAYRDMLPIQQMPADLPSPSSMSGFDDQSILGWTSAQGRSSALSSHTRGSNSVSTAGTSPVPRETILDRAFMLRCIPGSDRVVAAEEDGERLSSTARFEALMRDAEERLKKKAVSHPDRGSKNRVTSWNLDEEEDEDDALMQADERPETRDHDEGFEMEDEESDPMTSTFRQIPTPAQRALEYISGRSTPLAPTHKNSSNRPMSPPARAQASSRSKTTPPRVHQKKKERPKSMAFYSTKTSAEIEQDQYSSAKAHKRKSSNSTRRLSFTDFSKHLSSTSSLLLVQTNTSNGSMGGESSRNSRQSSEASVIDDPDENLSGYRGLSQSRLSGMGPPSMGIRGGGGGGPGGVGMEMDANLRGWRGSGFGVVGGEGGFL